MPGFRLLFLSMQDFTLIRQLSKMRLEILNKKVKRKELGCVTWSGNTELLSCGDDHKLILWNPSADTYSEITTLPETLYPTDVSWLPRALTEASKGGYATDIFAVGSSEGKFYIISKTGRVEKSVDGHQGAVLCIRWTYDGSALLSAGEDGTVKIWSRSGMLRVILAQNSVAVNSACWSADSSTVAFACGSSIHLRCSQQVGGLTDSSLKSNYWKAHDGAILGMDWNRINHLIITAGEDQKYKVWDSYGRNVFTSMIQDYPLTSVAWTPNGKNFAVGTFNMIRLCDEEGWTCYAQKIDVGSIFNLVWSTDGTKLAGASATGRVIISQLIERRVDWKNYVACQVSDNAIVVNDITNETVKEKLDIRDRILNMSVGWGHLIVVSSSQCLIYSFKNWNTPVITNLKESAIFFVLQAEKCFLLVDSCGMHVFSYDGRHLASPKAAWNRMDLLSARTCALSSDSIAVCNCQNWKSVNAFETETGKPRVKDLLIAESHEIWQIALDQNGAIDERKLAVLDKNKDLFLCSLRDTSVKPTVIKIGDMIEGIIFNDVTNMLCGIRDNQLVVWIHPSAALIDKNMLSKTQMIRVGSENERCVKLKCFLDNQITVRRQDGSSSTITISPFPSVLLDFLRRNKWDECVRLCRRLKDENLWSVLAVTAMQAKNLQIAQLAYANVNEVEQVCLLNHIRSISNKEIRNAEISLFCGDPDTAETIFLQSGYVFRAILMNIEIYRWDKALDMALRSNIHVDTVCAYRLKYLEDMSKRENNKRFLQLYSEVDTDLETAQEKVKEEYGRTR